MNDKTDTRIQPAPDGRGIVTYEVTGGRIALWDANSFEKLNEFEVPGGGGILTFALSPDGRRIVTGGFGGVAKVLDAASGQGLLNLDARSPTISAVSLSPDGRRVTTIADGGSVKIWEAATPQQMEEWAHSE